MFKATVVAITVFAASSSFAMERINVDKAPASSDRFTSRFEKGLTADQEAARLDAVRRSQQELRGVVETGLQGDKNAGWRIKRNIGAQDEVKTAGWRIKRNAGSEEAVQVAGWRIKRIGG